ncbi:MAG: hypothetical protein M3295_05940 [Chloroflexota bacterium]|nr:hypothetical protein [Chloroflexota bacterium]
MGTTACGIRCSRWSPRAVYIFYGKLSVYLKALERDAGEEWAIWIG